MTERDKLPDHMNRSIVARQNQMLAIVTGALRRLRPYKGKEARSFYTTSAMLFLGMLNWTYTWFNARGPVNGEALALYIYDLFTTGFQTTDFPASKS
jgi:hypothetical protein